MGYTTEFSGLITIDPPLNAEEISFLKKFSETRRMRCTQGPYYVDRAGPFGEDSGADVLDYNQPPAGQPGLWCQWTPSDDGNALAWDGGEKFYNPVEWMSYLMDHFIGARPIARVVEPKKFAFLQGHTCNGQINAEGEDRTDVWCLLVKDNVVTRKRATVRYDWKD